MKQAWVRLLAGVALAGLVCGGASAQTIVVGGKAFTEQQIMTAMTVALLKAKGFAPDRKAGMGSAAVRAALENGQIDVYWEYTGTGLGVFNKITDKFPSAEAAYQKIKEVDAAKGIVWLNMSPVNNTYGFAMNKDDAQKRGIVTMSDLRESGQGRREAHVRIERRVLCASRRAAGLADGVRLRVRPRQRQADGHRPHLLAAQGPAGRLGRGVRDRRAHSGVQLRRAEGRQELRGAVQPDAGRAQGNPRQEPEDRRRAQRARRQAQRRRRWRSSMPASTSTRRRRRKSPKVS